MNTATTLGIDAVNKARLSEVEGKAKLLVSSILANRASIKVHDETIKSNKEALAKLEVDLIKQTDVLDHEMSAPLNVNQQVIANVIAKMNEANTERVRLNSQSYINRITAAEKSIKELNELITKQVEDLNKLEADVVTAAQVIA